MAITVSIEGVATAQAALHGAAGAINAQLQTIIETTAKRTTEALASATPERTDTAKGGWKSSPIPGGAEVTNDVFYVPFLIEGTGRRRVRVVNQNWPGMKPNPALRDAWLRAPDEVAAEIDAQAAFAVSRLLP